jgi:hypothetical protein
MGKPEGKRVLRGPRRRLVGTIEMDLGEIRWSGMTGFICLRVETSGELL